MGDIPLVSFLYTFCLLFNQKKKSLLAEHHALVTTLTQCQEPRTYEEASKNPGWVQAMNKEIEALLAHNTWELVDLPRQPSATSRFIR